MLSRVSGVSGEIRAGYQRAAELGKWEMDVHRVIRADIVSASNFWLAQKPLDIRLRVGRRWWIWRGVDVSNKGSSVRVQVRGDPEHI